MDVIFQLKLSSHISHHCIVKQVCTVCKIGNKKPKLLFTGNSCVTHKNGYKSSEHCIQEVAGALGKNANSKATKFTCVRYCVWICPGAQLLWFPGEMGGMLQNGTTEQGRIEHKGLGQGLRVAWMGHADCQDVTIRCWHCSQKSNNHKQLNYSACGLMGPWEKNPLFLPWKCVCFTVTSGVWLNCTESVLGIFMLLLRVM